jgi:hypothetical protein
MLLTTENNVLMKKIALIPVHDNENAASEIKLLPAPIQHIRRSPNAYIVFTGEWRKTLATAHPSETSIEISSQ